jgi:hypothetical protein
VRKFLLLATMLAMMVAIMAISAVPAMAQPRIVAPNAFRDADVNALCSDVGFANSNPNLCRDFIDVNDIDNNFFDNPFRDRRFDDNFRRDNGFDIDQEAEPTGDVENTLRVTNTGNNSNQCVAPLQFGNTGNLQNAQGFSTGGSSNGGFFRDDGFFRNNDDDFFGRNDFFRNNDDDFFGRNDFFRNNGFGFNDGVSSLDDVEFEAPSFEFTPEQNVNCNQAVEQAASASGN